MRLPQLKFLAIVVFVIAAAVWFGFWLHHRLTHVSSKDAQVKTHEITVSSRLPGRVTQFSLILGDHLKNHEAVAQLYSKPDRLELAALQAQVNSVKAKLAAQKARLALANRLLSGGIEQTKDLLQTDIAAQKAAKEAMIRARKNAKRSERLYKIKAVSQKQRDNDRYTYLSAQARYEQAERQVKLDRIALKNAHNGMLTNPMMTLPNPSVLRNEEDAAKSHLSEVKAKLKHQQTRVNDLEVRSPTSGVVDKTFVDSGDYVSAGQPILMMHNPKDVWIEAKMKETKIHALRVGQPVRIHVDARPNADYRGHVQVIGNAATNQFALLPNPNPSGNFTKITQRIPVRIAIDHGPLDKLSPGMMVEVDIDTAAHDKAGQ